MQQEFLLLSPSTWNLVFLIARYVIAALLLAYLTGVYVKIGYQGMEYASLFDTPERLFSMGMELNRILNKDKHFIDYSLKNKLDDFQCWFDDVIMFCGTLP